jgi:hypothetical protein
MACGHYDVPFVLNAITGSTLPCEILAYDSCTSCQSHIYGMGLMLVSSGRDEYVLSGLYVGSFALLVMGIMSPSIYENSLILLLTVLK